MQTIGLRHFAIALLTAWVVATPPEAIANQAASPTYSQIEIDSVPSGAIVVNLPQKDGQGKEVELGKTPLTVDAAKVQSMRFAVMMGVDEYLKQIKPLPELREFATQFKADTRLKDNFSRLVQQDFDFGTANSRSTASREGIGTSFGTIYDLTVAKAPRICTLFVPLGVSREAFFPLMPKAGTFKIPPVWAQQLKSKYRLSDEDAALALEYLSRAGAYVISIKDPFKESAVTRVTITVSADGAIREVTRGNPLPGTPRAPATPRPPNPPPVAAGCSGYQARIEMKNGETRTLEDVCILNYLSMPRQNPVVSLLKDGFDVDYPLEKIQSIRIAGLIEAPAGGELKGLYANVHLTLKDGGAEVDGRTTGSFATGRAADPAPMSVDPVVVRGKDPDPNKPPQFLRYSEVQSIALTPPKTDFVPKAQQHYSPAVQAAARTDYEATLKRIQAGDANVNYRKFRLDAALMIGPTQANALDGADRQAFKSLMDAGKTEEALAAANASLDRNYAGIFAHMNALNACLKLNKSEEAALHRKIATALLRSIVQSGDGKSPETAWFAATISEEYAFLNHGLLMNRKSQSMAKQGDHFYDRMEAVNPKTNETKTFWFNTDVDMGVYPVVIRTPEYKDKLQQMAAFYMAGRHLDALPLVEELAAFDPEEAGIQLILADCLFFKSGTNVTLEEAVELRKRARSAATRAFQLGDTTPRVGELVSMLANPEAGPRSYSANADADKAMRNADQALGTGNYKSAIAAYSEALRLDPKIYQAAMYAGDVSFTQKDLAGAAQWFGKAIAINPGNATIYHHWADGLFMNGKIAEARDKYIEFVIAEPGAQSWAMLTAWAKAAKFQVAPPKIDRPTANVSDSPWAGYFSVREAWRQGTFAQKYPAAAEYRHTLEEETAALSAIAPQVAAVAELKNAGLLESWILLHGSDAGIARDYAGYRDAHHDLLRTYIEKYVIHSAN